VLQEDFLVDLFGRMQAVTFPAGYPIASRSSDCDRLYFVKFGMMKAALLDGATVETLNPGDYVGENSLLGERVWRTNAGLQVELFALEPVRCLMLTRDAFQLVLSEYPDCVHADIAAETKRLLAARRLQQRRWAQHASEVEGSPSVARLGRWFALAYKIISVLKAHDDPSATSSRLIARTLHSLKPRQAQPEPAAHATSKAKSGHEQVLTNRRSPIPPLAGGSSKAPTAAPAKQGHQSESKQADADPTAPDGGVGGGDGAGGSRRLAAGPVGEALSKRRQGDAGGPASVADALTADAYPGGAAGREELTYHQKLAMGIIKPSPDELPVVNLETGEGRGGEEGAGAGEAGGGSGG
jgi:CRP-like cAMP-binding protein